MSMAEYTESKAAPPANQDTTVPVYEDAWRQLKRIRVTAVFAVLVWLVWLVVERFADPAFEVTRQLEISFLACAAFWTYAILRYEWWRCPRCRHPFQVSSIIGPWTAWPRKQCIHCGLRVGS